MFHLVSKEGNVHRLVPSKVKAETLQAQGYTLVEPAKKAPKKAKEDGKAAGDGE